MSSTVVIAFFACRLLTGGTACKCRSDRVHVSWHYPRHFTAEAHLSGNSTCRALVQAASNARPQLAACE
jgi:hypothetical protein